MVSAVIYILFDVDDCSESNMGLVGGAIQNCYKINIGNCSIADEWQEYSLQTRCKANLCTK
jgi:hypothetical protein